MFEDFQELDEALNMTSFNDSVNKTFTVNGQPLATRTFNVYGVSIENVPIVNSTDYSSFVTGILWEYSDGFDVNGSFNGTQDVVFITVVNRSKQGRWGVYDFEIRFPALLRSYKSSGNSVDLYYELK